jgi:hypothetical protein
MSPAEIQDLTEKAGFDWESLGFRDRMCFGRLVELAAAKGRESLLVDMRSGEVQLPMQVAARWPSVPGSHKYAGAGGCQPGSFGPDSEDLFTTAQLLDYGDCRTAAERESIAQQVETTEWWKAPKWQSALCPITKSTIAAAIRARSEKEAA